MRYGMNCSGLVWRLTFKIIYQFTGLCYIKKTSAKKSRNPWLRFILGYRLFSVVASCSFVTIVVYFFRETYCLLQGKGVEDRGQDIPLKRLWTSFRLPCVLSQKTVHFIVTEVWTTDLTRADAWHPPLHKTMYLKNLSADGTIILKCISE